MQGMAGGSGIMAGLQVWMLLWIVVWFLLFVGFLGLALWVSRALAPRGLRGAGAPREGPPLPEIAPGGPAGPEREREEAAETPRRAA